MRFDQSAKLGLERSLAQTVAFRDRPITARHVLLGLVAADAGVMPRLLNELGTSPDRIRAALSAAD